MTQLRGIWPEPEKPMNLARLIYDHYPGNVDLPIDPDIDCKDMETLLAKVDEGVGDTLFTFIVREAHDTFEAGSLKDVYEALSRGMTDIAAVTDGIEQACNQQSDPGRKCESCGAAFTQQDLDGGRCTKCGHMIARTTSHQPEPAMEIEPYKIDCDGRIGKRAKEGR